MLVRNVRSHSSALISAMSSWVRCMAALLTRMSSRPNSATARCTISLAMRLLRDVARHQHGLRPASRTHWAVSSASSCSSR